MTHKIPAIVMVGPSWSVCTALGVVRSLGRAGIPVVCLLEKAQHPVAASRYVRSVHICPEPTEDALTAALLSVAQQQNQPPPVFPTSDRHCLLLAKHQEEIDRSVLWHRVSLATVEWFTDKALSHELAQRIGIRVPVTISVSTQEGVSAALAEVPRPWLIKPLGHYVLREGGVVAGHLSSVLGGKALLSDSAEEVERVVSQAKEQGKAVCIQEYVPGGDDRVYEVHTYIRHGGAAAVFVGRKIRQHPRLFGSACYAVSVPDWRGDAELVQAVQWSLSFTREARFSGICHFEWKRHEGTGLAYFIEANPRVSQWGILATRSGTNLPLWAYMDLLGEMPQGSLGDGLVDYFFRDELRDWRSYRDSGEGGSLWWLRYLRQLGRPLEGAFLVADDPLPGVNALARDVTDVVRRTLSRVRLQRSDARLRQ